MNRKQFIMSVASFCLTLTIGCGVNKTALLNTVIDSAKAILTVAEPDATWVPPLNASITALQTSEAAWVAGGPVTDVVNGLNSMQDVLASIPQTKQYSPLVAILDAGIEAIFTATGVTPSNAQVQSVASNPYHGVAQLKTPSVIQTYQGAYKKQWNDTAKSVGLNAAKIK